MAYDAYGRPMYARDAGPRRPVRSPPRSGRAGAGAVGRFPQPRQGGSGRSSAIGSYGRPTSTPPPSARPRSGGAYPSRPTSRRQARDEDAEDGYGEDEPQPEEEVQLEYEEPAEEHFEDEPQGDGAPEEDFEDGAPPEDENGEQAQEFDEEFGADEAGEAAEEEPQGEEEDPDLPKREDDLALEEVPEEMREPVQGNLTLKRLLSTESQPAANGTHKRRKLENGRAQVVEPVKQELLDKWKLGRDVASRYVVEAAAVEDVEALKKLNWHPINRGGEGRSVCEQIADKFLRHIESKCPSGGGVDAVAAFVHRRKLNKEDAQLLRQLCHKDLCYVMSTYDGTQSIDDLVHEASLLMPGEDSAADTAAPDKPGLFAMSRLNRLELIDPVADALVVGDANLTFSLVLAAHREGLGHVGRIVATTFETIETLRERYSEIDETVKVLEDKSAEVLHNVDCTRLAIDPRFVSMAGQFGAVYYNFPHAGVVNGFFDGHPFVRWRHENLMHLFFRALRAFVKPGGVVKVSSNSNATGVRYSDIMTGAASSEFVHVETVPFLEWQLRGYRRSYGDRRDAKRRPEDGEIYRSQRANSDMVYSFRYEPSGEAPPKPHIRYPPTKSDLLGSNEGRFKGQSEAAKKRHVEEIYQLFLSYVQGIHIG